MMTFLFAMQLITAQPIMTPEPERLIRIDVTLYQGDPSGKLQVKDKLASPQLLTRDGQKTLVAIGQTVVFRELEKTLVKGDTIQYRVAHQQIGAMMTFNPQLLADGQILLAGSIKTTEAVNMTDSIQHKIENDVRVAITCKQNRVVTIPLYTSNDQKPFTGKERWVELKVCEQMSGLTPLAPALLPKAEMEKEFK